MQEFTIRNKATNPILTLKAGTLRKLLAARPESVSLTLAKYRADYKGLTGKAIHLDHLQEQTLRKHAGADERGTWTGAYSKIPYHLFLITRLFTDGFMNRTSSESIQSDLELVEAFYDMVDDQLAKAPPPAKP